MLNLIWSPIQLLPTLDLLWSPIQLLPVLNLIWSPIQLLPVLDSINDIYRESDFFDKFDLLTFDPDEKKYKCTPAKWIVPIQIKSFYSV